MFSRPGLAEDQPAEPLELTRLLRAYFAEPEARQRDQLAAQVTELVAGNVTPVADALGKLQLWPEHQGGATRLDVEVRPSKSLTVEVLLPQDYDAQRRYPLILALHGARGQGTHMIGYLRQLLGERGNEFIVAAPTGYTPPTMLVPEEDAGQVLEVLAAVRRQFHIDTNRVYAVGYSMGGHCTFGLATLYGDQFAAAIPLAGTLIVPYHQARAIMLTNLVNTPVFACWGAEDKFDDNGQPAPGDGVAGVNRAVAVLAREAGVPFRGEQLPGVGHRDVVPPVDVVMSYLETTRNPAPRRVNHWFRYPVQGHSAWLRQVKFAGQPWAGEQLSIVTRLGEDYDQYVTDTLKKKLAFLGGTIDGQTIDVHTRRTAETSVLLNDGLIDLDQPIVLKLNGKIRYEGRVERRIATMLGTAYDDWDFQRLYTVRLVVRRNSLARQD